MLKYIKDVNSILGNSVILVSTKAFYELCHKYGLSVGFLQEFTGVIPTQNLNELMEISDKLHADDNSYKLDLNNQMVRVTRISNYSDKSDTYIKKRLEYYFNMLQVSTFSLSDINLHRVENFTEDKWADRVYVDGDSASPYDFFIACPKSNLREKPVIVSTPIDPIIFQYCPFGVLVYTMWGEEAEDKVFEEYKKLNNLI